MLRRPVVRVKREFRGPLSVLAEKQALFRNMKKLYDSLLADQGRRFAESPQGMQMAREVSRLGHELGVFGKKPHKPVD